MGPTEERESSSLTLGLEMESMDLRDFLGGNMWVMRERDTETAVVGEIQIRRWVVRVRMPAVYGWRFGWVERSGSMSTAERRKHSTSPEESTGLPLVVSSAVGSHFPAIVVMVGEGGDYGEVIGSLTQLPYLTDSLQ